MESDLRHCQNCGMPLEIDKLHFSDTNTDSASHRKFCLSCNQVGSHRAMEKLDNTIISALTGQGASLIRFVDVTGLSAELNRGLPNAILFCIALPPSYVQKVKETADYVQTLIAQNQIENDEFHLTELKAGELSDRIADMLRSNGYRAHSLSDENVIATGGWDEKNLRTLLPQKTVAVLAGAGWVGKNNLLITQAYGPALCIGTVLTDAPLTISPAQMAENNCKACRTCVDICPTHALYGIAWEKHIPREERIDVHKCTTCMKCLVYCSYTQKYLKRSLQSKK